MSAPEANPVATGIELPAGCDPVQVATEAADVFIRRDDGFRAPIGTVTAGGWVFPLGQDLTVLAVGRTGAQLEQQPVPVEELDSARTTFIDTVVATIRCDPSSDLDALADNVERYLAAVAAERVAAAHASADFGSRQSTAELDRIAYSSSELRQPGAPRTDTPLLTVVAVLAKAQGFTVTAPTVEEMRSTQDPLRAIAHKSGVRYRPVSLTRDWRTGTGSYLGFFASDDGQYEPVALLQHRGNYQIQRSTDLAPRRLEQADADRLDKVAVEFFPPLDRERPIRRGDAIRLAMGGTGSLWGVALLTALGATLIGLLTPILTNSVVGAFIPQGRASAVTQVGIALALAATVAFVLLLVQNYAVSAISQRSTRVLQAAFWDRMLSLPSDFYRNFSSGDLTVRVLAVDELAQLLSVQVVSALLAAGFGIVYVVLLFSYNVLLAVAAFLFIALTVGLLLVALRRLTYYASAYIAAQRKAAGWMVQLLTAIPKIRLAGAEDRMSNPYLELVRGQALAGSKQTSVLGRVNAWFIFAASAGPALLVLMVGLQWGTSGNITTAQFMAFTSAYGLAFAAVSGLTSLMIPLANAGPIFDLLQPVMDELPETAGNLQDPGELTGHVELRNVVFRYDEDSPIVLDNLSLVVQPGEMVALVGPSGAGKSTITRILLGFEQPESGEVLFDGRVFDDLDPTLVRGQMGVVVQSGQIMRGTILRNITGSPTGDEQAAWAAAESAAFADDIRAMPMGMHTIVDPQNISGGQAQRILLARALISQPPIMILDEATSALDNAAQAKVTSAMSDLQATRIVIAHRLSTIRSADRIIVLERGRVVEQGGYDELLAADGAFAKLVKRQVA